ncbi:MAG: serine/threonine-protein kinase [Gemmatimonadota bacterium]|nr:serine/threonine-protein kinase [Gemmatimonadota bacterium]
MQDLKLQLQAALGDAYSVDTELGGGGMSRVFRARDRALDRDVVVKVFPADTAAALSAERFKREIALAAKLQHPHIVPLLSAGTTAHGLPYYTMPFVEGESLRARLTREGELSNAEVVGILREVARALAYAHDRGIVHRDIKPDNVMLSGGAAMVTDFGVAKAVRASISGEAAPQSSATTLTQLGASLGTPAYMAPEQASGDPSVDRRADLYALGCMAYEMLTGCPPFTGRNVSTLLGAHLHDTPEPVDQRRPSVSPALAELVMQCLEKRPADRPSNAGEVLRALDVVMLASGAVPSISASAIARRTRGRGAGRLRRVTATLPWMIAALALVAFAWRSRVREQPREAPVRFTVTRLGDEGPMLAESDPAISPDGRLIVYRAALGASSRLDQRAAGAFASTPIAGTEGATHPFFSPDGKRLAFFAGGKLQSIPTEGGPATLIAEVPASSGASWAPNGDIIVGGAVGTRGVGLRRIPAGSGSPVPLTRPDTRSGEAHVAPIVLRDGKTILFQSESGTGGLSENVVAIGSLETGEYVKLPVVAVRPLGIIDNWLVYTRSDGAVMAVAFHVDTRNVSGDPKALGITVADFALNVALSANGTLVYSQGDTRSRIVWVDAQGAIMPVVDEPREYEFPRLSPDGSRLAIAVHGALSTDVWLADVATGAIVKFTKAGRINDRPEWSADGSRLLYRSTRDGASALWLQPADGSGVAERVTPGSSVWEGVLSPDGNTVLYRETVAGKGGYRVLYRGLAGDREPHLFAASSGNLQMPRFSPDGKWVLYQSDESGQFEIYVRPFPSGSGKYQVSLSGGTEPLWSQDGQRIYYRRGTQLVTATVRRGASITVLSRREILLDTTAQSQSRTHPKYDVARDGRVIMPRWIGDGTRLGVVLNWGEELRQIMHR